MAAVASESSSYKAKLPNGEVVTAGKLSLTYSRLLLPHTLNPHHNHFAVQMKQVYLQKKLKIYGYFSGVQTKLATKVDCSLRYFLTDSHHILSLLDLRPVSLFCSLPRES